ncbi:UdgX family uracil-DNA binding protein [Lysobacter sp. H21R4]|uniref:UdgX family uracil-DNA binding protein n=1 Tax=Lysobacter sp. H21R4 TaxID=2781021 RepID=UPI0018877460|nr:UdgX family uracil-DNA binding protein [Lysobacter sp. H21R4]QOY63705.1 UdgX family uracil-DNA binding protein [Lysobacter sp. H21R4]
MVRTQVEPGWSLDAWRGRARAALAAGVPPEDLQWDGDAQQGLALGAPLPDAPEAGTGLVVPGRFIELASAVLCHRDPNRHGLLYRLLWRIVKGERRLLERATDPDVVAASALAAEVRRDTHKMKAFVRFRQIREGEEAYVAWFEPDHWILDRVAPFFAKRFAGMRWAILTPYRSVRWDGAALDFGPGGVRADAPAEDAREDLWLTYYANIFNPARLNPTMMRQEMPQKYWKGLPEAALLPSLLREAGSRVRDMAEREAQQPRRKIPARAAAPTPASVDLGSLAAARAQAAECRRCPLWEPPTQTVWGEGPQDARVMFIGEQPGDAEDLTGRPFVGPAGALLDRAFTDAGIDRAAAYLTNAVKHFRFEQRGKVRLHKRPDAGHVRACHVWLQQELATVRPDTVVCLGATAASAVFGNAFKLTQERGRWHTLGDGVRAMATVHPAWVLRQPPAARESAYRGLVADLLAVSSERSESPR